MKFRRLSRAPRSLAMLGSLALQVQILERSLASTSPLSLVLKRADGYSKNKNTVLLAVRFHNKLETTLAQQIRMQCGILRCQELNHKTRDSSFIDLVERSDHAREVHFMVKKRPCPRGAFYGQDAASWNQESVEKVKAYLTRAAIILIRSSRAIGFLCCPERDQSRS